jgi:hypothetical protein
MAKGVGKTAFAGPFHQQRGLTKGYWYGELGTLEGKLHHFEITPLDAQNEGPFPSLADSNGREAQADARDGLTLLIDLPSMLGVLVANFILRHTGGVIRLRLAGRAHAPYPLGFTRNRRVLCQR